jgi:hypothetical protein
MSKVSGTVRANQNPGSNITNARRAEAPDFSRPKTVYFEHRKEPSADERRALKNRQAKAKAKASAARKSRKAQR